LAKETSAFSHDRTGANSAEGVGGRSGVAPRSVSPTAAKVTDVGTVVVGVGCVVGVGTVDVGTAMV
jgi:hypothetical protein